MDNYATHTPMDHEEDPEVLAQNYTCRPFPDTESVIKGTMMRSCAHNCMELRRGARSCGEMRGVVFLQHILTR